MKQLRRIEMVNEKFAPVTGIYWFDFTTWTLKQGDKYREMTTNHAVHQEAEKEYKTYLKLKKKISRLLEGSSVHEIKSIIEEFNQRT